MKNVFMVPMVFIIAFCVKCANPIPQSDTVPSAPTNLVASSICSYQISLNWIDTSNNEEGFWIEKKNDIGTFDLSGSAPANVTNYVDDFTIKEFGAIYEYRIRSYNTSGWSYSNIAAVELKYREYRIDGASGVAGALGSSIALSNDGSTLIAGAWTDDTSGSAFVYSRIGTDWIQKGLKLTDDTGGSSDRFGLAVSTSSAGEYPVAGAPWNNVYKGSFYAYYWNTDQWSGGKMASGEAMSDQFGNSVAITGSGDFIFAGAVYNGNGAVYLYEKSGNAWIAYADQLKITASDGDLSDDFGRNLAISADGEWLVIAAEGDDDKAANAGAVYIYRLNVDSYEFHTKATASDGLAGDNFGWSVAVNSDNMPLIVVGAADSNNQQGCAYIFEFNGGAWNEIKKLTASDAADGDQYGSSVAVSMDRETIVVGAPKKERASETDAGAAYAYKRITGNEWYEIKLDTITYSNDSFGYSVSTSGNGGIIAVGAKGRNSVDGAVFIYD